MIESRYKIEYVLPDDDVKKTSAFRVLWYLLLIPLILIAVVAITYDFSVQNISRDSAVLIEKAKVHIFNLGDKREFKKPEVKFNNIAKTNQQKEQTIEKTPIIEKPKVDIDKKILTDLTEKQKLQLKTIKEQTAKNTELSKDLTLLSKQLVLEKTRNETLNTRLSAEEKDRSELEQQLNRMLSDSETNEIRLEGLNVEKNNDNKDSKPEKSLVTATEVTPEKQTVTERTEVVENQLTKETPIFESTDAVEVTNTDKTKSILEIETDSVIIEKLDAKVELEKVVTTEEVEKPEKSDTDKIIEAMANIKTDSDKLAENIQTTNTEAVAEISKETIKVNNSKENQIDTQIQTIDNTNTDNKVTTSEEAAEKAIIPISAESEKPETLAITIETTPLENEVGVTTEPKPETDKNEKVVVEVKEVAEEPKTNSAVDDIIAAMQDSQVKPIEVSSDEIQDN